MSGAWATLWYSVIWHAAYGEWFRTTFAKLNIFRTICEHRCGVLHNADDCLSLYRWYLSLDMIHSYDKRIRYSQKDYAFLRSALPLLMLPIFFVSKSGLIYPFNSSTESPKCSLRFSFRCFDHYRCVFGAESALPFHYEQMPTSSRIHCRHILSGFSFVWNWTCYRITTVFELCAIGIATHKCFNFKSIEITVHVE